MKNKEFLINLFSFFNSVKYLNCQFFIILVDNILSILEILKNQNYSKNFVINKFLYYFSLKGNNKHFLYLNKSTFFLIFLSLTILKVCEKMKTFWENFFIYI